jgi:hypothetical protein
MFSGLTLALQPSSRFSTIWSKHVYSSTTDSKELNTIFFLNPLALVYRTISYNNWVNWGPAYRNIPSSQYVISAFPQIVIIFGVGLYLRMPQ